ncbi:MAG: hypothetical protein RLZ75_135 [Pseudomonadota bacterium]|jgi:phosphate transport system substrate-binding protein
MLSAIKKVLFVFIWIVLVFPQIGFTQKIDNHREFSMTFILANPSKNTDKLPDNLLELAKPIYVKEKDTCDESVLLINKLSIKRLDTRKKEEAISEFGYKKVADSYYGQHEADKWAAKMGKDITFEKFEPEMSTMLGKLTSPILADIATANISTESEWKNFLNDFKQSDNKKLFIAPDVSEPNFPSTVTPIKTATVDEYKQKLTDLLCKSSEASTMEFYVLADSITVKQPDKVQEQEKPKSTPQLIPVNNTVPNYNYILRVHGSNTVDAHLTPALAKAYLAKLGGVDPKEESPSQDEKIISVEINGIRRAIEIHSHGSKTAFKDLRDGSADIGAASRQIETEEQSGLGNMHSRQAEHIIGLDGIAIIVHHSNPLTSLTIEQIRKIFTGEINNWQSFNGQDNTINLYARDEKSGTFDGFKSMVLKGQALSNNAKNDFENGDELSDAVANDPNGIGFVGMSSIKDSKVIAVASAKDIVSLLPTADNVRHEYYPLNRRLYYYTTAKNYANRDVSDFINYALSDEGQNIITQHGSIGQNQGNLSDKKPVTCEPNCGNPYEKLINSAKPLDHTFYFNFGEAQNMELDNKGWLDLQRMIPNSQQAKEIILIGFADSKGTPEVNKKLSEKRAEFVREQIRKEIGVEANIITAGFGKDYPKFDNDTEEGRQKNRRVEVWVK